MIMYNLEKKIDFDRLRELFNEAGWKDKTGDIKRLEAMITNSQIVVSAWDGKLMVGFARCVTDYIFNGQINNVVVDARYRGQGIGKTLVRSILESSRQVTYILRGDSENQNFYAKLGFKLADFAFVSHRSE